MKSFYRFTMAFLVVLSFVLVESCQKENVNDFASVPTVNSQVDLNNVMSRTFYGPTLPVGNGVGRAWVQIDANGDPTSVGLNLSGKALEGLPEEDQQFVFFFPKVKGKNFYTHMLVDWNPHGHEPAGIYDKPHFDFHFYIISNEARMAIGPNDLAQFANAPAPQYVPSDYWQIPGGVPQMGAHWADLESPEFNGGTFTKTFIWGSYDGAFIFWEPMITMDYLMSHPDETTAVRQPAEYARDGWYAMNYKVSYSEKPDQYTVALTDLTYHQGQ